MTDEEREEIAILLVEVRGLAMGFAARREELERLEALATRSADVIWFVDPTSAIQNRSRIDRHMRFVKASAAFARTMHALLLEELGELGDKRAREAKGLG